MVQQLFSWQKMLPFLVPLVGLWCKGVSAVILCLYWRNRKKPTDVSKSASLTNLKVSILVVQLIDARKQAEKFAYRLELNGPGRRLTWEATPRSIREDTDRYETRIIKNYVPRNCCILIKKFSVIADSDCLVFDTSAATIFSKNENLGINVTIWLYGEKEQNQSSGEKYESARFGAKPRI